MLPNSSILNDECLKAEIQCCSRTANMPCAEVQDQPGIGNKINEFRVARKPQTVLRPTWNNKGDVHDKSSGRYGGCAVIRVCRGRARSGLRIQGQQLCLLVESFLVEGFLSRQPCCIEGSCLGKQA